MVEQYVTGIVLRLSRAESRLDELARRDIDRSLRLGEEHVYRCEQHPRIVGSTHCGRKWTYRRVSP